MRDMVCGFSSRLEALAGTTGCTSERRFLVKFHGRALLCVLTTAIAGAGCSGPATATNPYSEDFRQAKEFATSDFERAVLEDGEITRAEYEEAMQRYVALRT